MPAGPAAQGRDPRIRFACPVAGLDFSVTAILTLEGTFDGSVPDPSFVEFVAGCEPAG